MSTILVLSANMATMPYPVYPLGMAHVAGALTQAGHDVRQWDRLASGGDTQSLVDLVGRFAPDVLCLSLRNIDDVDSTQSPQDSWGLDSGRRVVEVLRGVSDAPIVAGGTALSIMPEQVRAYVGADYGVTGEGEQTVLKVIDDLANGRPVETIVTPTCEPLSGKGIPQPSHDDAILQYYLRASGVMAVQTKRGCPYHCSYCTYPLIEGPKVRALAAGDVVDHIERLQRDHGAESFFFADSVFNDAGGHYLHVVEELLRREVKVKWSAYFTPAGMDAATVALCRRSGMYAVELGTDAASDATLSAMGKSFTWAEAAAAGSLLTDHGVACAHFVIFGGPDETPEPVAEGLANIAALDRCVVFAFSGVRLYPNAAITARAMAEGAIDESTDLFRGCYYVSPAVDKAWMDETIEQAWADRADRIFPVAKSESRIRELRSLGWKGLLWDKIPTLPGTGRRRAP